ncbi:MAG: hypothetical protein ABI759_12675 [Candidatus Solibacter sp.]
MNWALRFAGAALVAGILLGGIDSTLLPLDDPAIRYATAPTLDRATQLDARLRSGELKLSYHRDFGYLISLLKALDVPVSSQVLVFSKTSFQAHRIAPRTPRALYHSADISIGFVRGGDVLEIAATDPKQGIVFYSLDQEQSPNQRLVRREECIQCHHGASTLGVPGLVLRSVHADRTGQALGNAKSFLTDYRSPLDQRWGGWYVTGLSGKQHHMGNQTVTDRDAPEYDHAAGSNVESLDRFFDTPTYLTGTSDIVSLMTFEHEIRFTNLVTRLGWESRLGRDIDPTVEELVKAIFFEDEAPLTDAVQGSREFATAFAAAAIRDKAGRSLRDFDLRTRMFQYRCSYLVYSEQFDALPAPAREKVWRRVYDSLAGAAPSKLPEAERRAVLEILRDTKKLLPDYFRAR